MVHERRKENLAFFPHLSGRRIDRRRLIQLASALGASAATMGAAARWAGVAAQDGQPIKSITREEYKQQLYAVFPPADDPPRGGTFIMGDSTDIGTTNYVLGSDEPTNPILSMVQETLVSH